MVRGPILRRVSAALVLLALVVGTLSAAVAFAGDPTRYEEDHPNVSYTGTWLPSFLPGHSGGSVAYSSDDPDATATFTFSGTGVDYIAATWYNRGIAAVSLNGGPEEMIDLYSPGIPGDTTTVGYQQVVYSVRDLPDGPHTLTVRVTGDSNPAASSPYLITVDAFDVFVEPPVVSVPASSWWSLALLAAMGLAVIGVGASATAKRRAT